MRRLRLPELWVLSLTALLFACADDEPDMVPGTDSDSGADASDSGDDVPDTGTDTNADTVSDAVLDAPSDVASDVPPCDAQCEDGESRCTGDTLETCVADDDGCFDWNDRTECTDVGQICVEDMCAEPTCDDGRMAGDETGVDCGGSCPACGAGGGCNGSEDCASGVCSDGLCSAAECGDGVTNGDEECDDGNEVDDDECANNCTVPDPSVVARTIDALGGTEALEALTGFTVETTASAYVHDQGFSAGDPAALASTDTKTVYVELATDSVRIDYTRVNDRFGGLPMNYRETVVGDVGAIDGVDSIFGTPGGDMTPARVGSTQQTARFLHPHIIVARIVADPSVVTELGQQTHEDSLYDVLALDDGAIELWLDPDTALLARLVTLENSHLHRDQTLEVTYADWQEFGTALQFPGSVALSLDGEPVITELRTAVTVNPDLSGVFELSSEGPPAADPELAAWGTRSSQFHQMFASTGIPLDARQTLVIPTELAPGVFHLTGGSHHSLAVEQDVGIVIVDAPLYPERSEAIIAWAGTVFPGKSITHVIASHHHGDHSAGLRAFVAAGATVVLGAPSVDALAAIVAAPSSVEPDTLAGSPAVATIEGVDAGGSFGLDAAFNPVAAHRITTSHSDDMLIVGVGDRDMLVFVSDLYIPGSGGAALNPLWASELLDGIDEAGLEVGLLVGSHGGTAPYSELESFLAR